MKQLLMGVLAVMLSACAAQPASRPQPADYHLLFTKHVATPAQGCVAAYSRNGLLYFMLQYKHRSPSTVVYDPTTGLFLRATLQVRPGHGSPITCRRPSFRHRKFMSNTTILDYVKPSAFKHRLDNFASDPQGLEKTISSADAILRHSGQWKGRRIAEAFYPAPTEIHDVQDATAYLHHLTKHQAATLISTQLARVHRKAAEQAQASWIKHKAQPLAQGDQICTFTTNLYGYVQRRGASKVEMYVLGKALPPGGGQGYFYSGAKGAFTHTSINAIRWFPRRRVARCNF